MSSNDSQSADSVPEEISPEQIPVKRSPWKRYLMLVSWILIAGSLVSFIIAALFLSKWVPTWIYPVLLITFAVSLFILKLIAWGPKLAVIGFSGPVIAIGGVAVPFLFPELNIAVKILCFLLGVPLGCLVFWITLKRFQNKELNFISFYSGTLYDAATKLQIEQIPKEEVEETLKGKYGLRPDFVDGDNAIYSTGEESHLGETGTYYLLLTFHPRDQVSVVEGFSVYAEYNKRLYGYYFQDGLKPLHVGHKFRKVESKGEFILKNVAFPE